MRTCRAQHKYAGPPDSLWRSFASAESTKPKGFKGCRKQGANSANTWVKLDDSASKLSSVLLNGQSDYGTRSRSSDATGGHPGREMGCPEEFNGAPSWSPAWRLTKEAGLWELTTSLIPMKGVSND